MTTRGNCSPTPTVSVVIPTYYRNDRLIDAIESVLAQTHESVELIVVDDSGKRHAEQVVESYSLKYIAHDENCGGNVARTTGIRAATGDYVQLLDDDDRIAPTKLQRQVALIESMQEAGVIYCGVQESTGNVRLPDPAKRGDVLEFALRFEMYPCQTSTMLIDADILEDVLPLTERGSGDDLSLIIELTRRTQFDFVDEVLADRHIATDSRGRGIANAEARLQIIDDYDELYDKFDSSVRRGTLSHAYRMRARSHLDKALWSATALRDYARAIRYAPTVDVKLVAEAGSAVFGAPLVKLLRKVNKMLVMINALIVHFSIQN
jgi:glycosyltransferase involved in cell wall biosynthesis